MCNIERLKSTSLRTPPTLRHEIGYTQFYLRRPVLNCKPISPPSLKGFTRISNLDFTSLLSVSARICMLNGSFVARLPCSTSGSGEGVKKHTRHFSSPFSSVCRSTTYQLSRPRAMMPQTSKSRSRPCGWTVPTYRVPKAPKASCTLSLSGVRLSSQLLRRLPIFRGLQCLSMTTQDGD